MVVSQNTVRKKGYPPSHRMLTNSTHKPFILGVPKFKKPHVTYWLFYSQGEKRRLLQRFFFTIRDQDHHSLTTINHQASSPS